MDMSVAGRVAKIRLAPSARNSLIPLFEAIVNSIHAIQAANDGEGTIDIRIERDGFEGVLEGPDGKKIDDLHVAGFTVIDTGIGFDDANYKSFSLADTPFKKAIGGQGIGRLMWLKTFSEVQIDSVFGAEKTNHRTFGFNIEADGICEHKLAPKEPALRQTIVKLIGMLPEFKETCPRRLSVIALHIVDHCVEFLALPKAPRMTLVDPLCDDKKNLNDLFNKELKLSSQTTNFRLKGKDFKLNHILMRKTHHASHVLNFCANDRPSHSESLAEHVSNLPKTLIDTESGKAMVYNGYLSGKYLNDYVTSERTGFHQPGSDELPFDGGLPWGELVERAVQEAKGVLEPHLEPIAKAKEEQIRSYVERKAYQYRPLYLHRKDLIETIPPNLSESQLDLELYKRDREYDKELRQTGYELLQKGDRRAENLEDHQKKVDQFLQEWNDKGKHQLAVYVAHRKAILSYFSSQLKVRENGKYNLEEDIHRIIFPLKKTSDDVPVEQMNLWIIDERLAFHRYLASDKYLDQSDAVESDAHVRPDILIFDQPFAFSETLQEFGAVVIVEFKRPMRTEYDDNENPIMQVGGYIEKIKAGKAKSREGRPLTLVNPNTPFYAYIVCDLTEKMRAYAKGGGLIPTPDNQGYFGYNPSYGAYMEVISFDKLISDARKRNAVFFEKLHIGTELFETPTETSGRAADSSSD